MDGQKSQNHLPYVMKKKTELNGKMKKGSIPKKTPMGREHVVQWCE